jgi:hypothetical protein
VKVFTAGETLTNVNDIGPYLASQSGNPVPFTLQLALGNTQQTGSTWRQLLQAIEDAGKNVALDLSACDIEAVEFYGDSYEGKFDPDNTVSTGKDKIVSITLPNTATSIIDIMDYPLVAAFQYFTNLKSFSGDGLTTIGRLAFYNISSLAMSSLPAGIINIGYNAFGGCTNLVLAELPTGVEMLDSNIFDGCTGITEITIYGENIVLMSSTTFNNCENLARVTFYRAIPIYPESSSLFDLLFDGCADDLKIFVPKDSVDVYKAANFWKVYADQIFAIE